MALTQLQRDILSLIADNRIQHGESYVAGGTALNLLLNQPRLSRDIDLFHDRKEALLRTWQSDMLLLEHAGYQVNVVRELTGLVEVVVRQEDESTRIEWAVDSAFRFFPLVRHDVLGLTLHPFDLATNEVLALVGRLEARDWIDVIGCEEKLQPLGYLAWAACGKDPGLSPELILGEASRSGRYTQEEIDTLDFEGRRPDAPSLGRAWKSMVRGAAEVVRLLPPESVGTCVLHASGGLFRGHPGLLTQALARGEVLFHPGHIRGAFPSFPGSVQ